MSAPLKKLEELPVDDLDGDVSDESSPANEIVDLVLDVYDRTKSMSAVTRETGVSRFLVRKIVRGYRRHAFTDSRARSVTDQCDAIELYMDDMYDDRQWALVTDAEVRPAGITDFQWREIRRGLNPEFMWRVVSTKSQMGSDESATYKRYEPGALDRDQRFCIEGLVDYLQSQGETSNIKYTEWRKSAPRPYPSVSKIRRCFDGSWVSAVLTAGLIIEVPTYDDLYGETDTAPAGACGCADHEICDDCIVGGIFDDDDTNAQEG